MLGGEFQRNRIPPSMPVLPLCRLEPFVSGTAVHISLQKQKNTWTQCLETRPGSVFRRTRRECSHTHSDQGISRPLKIPNRAIDVVILKDYITFGVISCKPSSFHRLYKLKKTFAYRVRFVAVLTPYILHHRHDTHVFSS